MDIIVKAQGHFTAWETPRAKQAVINYLDPARQWTTTDFGRRKFRIAPMGVGFEITIIDPKGKETNSYGYGLLVDDTLPIKQQRLDAEAIVECFETKFTRAMKNPHFRTAFKGICKSFNRKDAEITA